MTPDFRSYSFSPTCSLQKTPLNDNAKIFCVDDHRRGANLSSENIRLCCEEKLRLPRRHSPCGSPHRSPRAECCRAVRAEGAECLVHGGRRTRKRGRRMEGSLSAEEQGSRRRGQQGRSASFSPTRSPKGSSSPGKQSSCSAEEKPETEEPS